MSWFTKIKDKAGSSLDQFTLQVNATAKSRVGRIWTVVAVVLFFGVLIGLAVALLLTPAGDPEPKPTGTGSSKPNVFEPDDKKPTEEPPAGDGVVGKKPVLGADGFVTMKVTTDPREAAASAASVLMSVDGSKVKWVDDFRAEALKRVFHPSPEYQGPGDSISVSTTSGTQYTGSEIEQRLLEVMSNPKVQYSASSGGNWWRLSDASQYEGVRGSGAKVWATPIEVYDAKELAEATGDSSWLDTTPTSEYHLEQMKNGATFGVYWVRSIETASIGVEHDERRVPAVFTIYCDPPIDGGLCAVAGMQQGFPSQWPSR